jgi:hypothetical protein
MFDAARQTNTRAPALPSQFSWRIEKTVYFNETKVRGVVSRP